MDKNNAQLANISNYYYVFNGHSFTRVIAVINSSSFFFCFIFFFCCESSKWDWFIYIGVASKKWLLLHFHLIWSNSKHLMITWRWKEIAWLINTPTTKRASDCSLVFISVFTFLFRLIFFVLFFFFFLSFRRVHEKFVLSYVKHIKIGKILYFNIILHVWRTVCKEKNRHNTRTRVLYRPTNGIYKRLQFSWIYFNKPASSNRSQQNAMCLSMFK